LLYILAQLRFCFELVIFTDVCSVSLLVTVSHGYAVLRYCSWLTSRITCAAYHRFHVWIQLKEHAHIYAVVAEILQLTAMKAAGVQCSLWLKCIKP
jgi:hypothetical protein